MVSSAEVSHVVTESVLSQGVKSADGTCVNDSKSQAPPFEVAGIQGVKIADSACVNDSKSQAPALEVAGIQVVNNQRALDMSSDPEVVNAVKR